MQELSTNIFVNKSQQDLGCVHPAWVGVEEPTWSGVGLSERCVEDGRRPSEFCLLPRG